jgi:dolichyl-phosphate-mannose-protein mannosyltransferase
LKREFYFDVHPPLGKILVGFAGLLSGYTGDFGFESGAKYPPTLNYTMMRVILSLYGSLMVPLAYLTCIELGLRRRTAVLAALLVMCDNAYLSISRYILLDAMLLFFTVCTVYCMSAFHNSKQRGSFTGEWWFWMCATGWSIGMVSSIKWIGFFVTALVKHQAEYL